MASVFNWFKRGQTSAQKAATPADLIKRGNDFLDKGNLDAARTQYQAALTLDPDNADACICLGFVLKQAGQFEAAKSHLERAAQLNPNSEEAHYLLGLVAEALGDVDAATRHIAAAVEIKPDFVLGWRDLGRVQFIGGHYDEARMAIERGLELAPQSADLHLYLGNIKLHERDFEAAVACYDKAVALAPDHAEAYFSRGHACAEMHHLNDALTNFDSAISIRPDYVEAHTHRGKALVELGQLDDAVASFDRALATNPNHLDALVNRGHALSQLRQYPEAIEAYDRALVLTQNVAFLFGQAMHTRMKICDWHTYASDIEQLTARIQQGERCIHAFPALALTTDLALLRQVAEACDGETPEQPFDASCFAHEGAHSRIRIGYYSADFYMHPVSYLMAEVFELHDKSKFELFGFAFGKNRKDAMTHRISAAFDRFIDVRDMSDQKVAELSRELGIDIAIDLGGHTTDSRPGIFAHRAAPVQAGYLGYLGTMGAPYFDYLLADKAIIPEEYRPYYSERIVYLPCYQANDSKRVISDRVFTRAELGLPETGFVFCCFNSNYKITPPIFDAWMHILGQVKGSVLLLYATNESVMPNLKREAERRGVDPARLVFTGGLPRPEYLARYRAADLFLDTFPYNAGTTASDALWAGLPVLTQAGMSFASRVAASVLQAIGLPELIARTRQEYEDMAVELATNPDLLNQLRERLERNRQAMPLFDCKRFTTNLEAAYMAMYERHRAGLAPDHIEIRD